MSNDVLIHLLADALPPPPEWWATVERDLSAPFPYFGGKRKVAHIVWDRFGDCVNYVEPFFGSGAVLLARPHAPTIETVNDLDGHLCNAWRSIAWYPDDVAAACDWPVNEIDLHARHRYLTRLRGKLSARLLEDPMHCSPMIAGWWLWGICAWIGSGWCSERGAAARKRPEVGAGGDGDRPRPGKGVHSGSMRKEGRLPSMGGTGRDHGRGVHGLSMRGKGKMPLLTGGRAGEEPEAQHGKGVHAKGMRLPHLGAGTGGEDDHPCAHYGRGVHGQGMRVSQQLPELGGQWGNGKESGAKQGKGVHSPIARTRLYDVFRALSNRLRYVRVTCGDFERILSPAVTWRHGTTGVFLDPPYPADAGLASGLYSSTKDEREVFDRAFRWALANGGDKRMRIAFCGYDGTMVDGRDAFATLKEAGWDVVAWKSHGGYGGQSGGENVNAKRERIAFSPGCLKAAQGSLF